MAKHCFANLVIRVDHGKIDSGFGIFSRLCEYLSDTFRKIVIDRRMFCFYHLRRSAVAVPEQKMITNRRGIRILTILWRM